ncbi:hypothetical protein [Pseudolactococcus reticulitermitis]|uniref:Uncharacterized protein n=1 Tax=Pseudolactococcus reticulitermitis TaxID=2025039 RepID=A0A224XC89_9LACT|nr:hypothetical protein [Lactococcus reticulitermitis]GAX47241.1 hypothetical protein RsY01_840 [Lactococcus reticulitermitis]
MMMASFEDKRLTVTFPEHLGQLDVLDLTALVADTSKATFYFKGSNLVTQKTKADRVLVFSLPVDIDPIYFKKHLMAQKVPSHQTKVLTAYLAQLAPYLDLLGYQFKMTPQTPETPPKSSGKAQYRFSKAIADIPFYVDYDGAKAEVYWLKRNDMVIKKGAVLKQDMPLNQDGSIGFAQKFAMTLRQEHAEAIGTDFVTTADIHLKSVNEVGHLLYFAGTNSWLVLKDQNGQTLSSHTVVK